ncbi:MAG: hypothetical protein HY507_00935 [Candidatus Zambryskibacteria bacterium]|nr:hypothetical protein [Candidatus Zambryskibacteria bacterium]
MVWIAGKSDFIFTFVALNQIKAVDRGKGNFIKLLANLPIGWRINRNDWTIIPGRQYKGILEALFGLYYIGLPPASVHRFSFVHERPNPDIGNKTPSSEWLLRDEDEEETDFLLFDFPHSYVIPDIEFRNQFRGDIMFTGQFYALKPVVAIYTRGGKFFELTRQYVEAAVIDKLREMSYSDFLLESKDSDSPLSRQIRNILNPHLQDDPNPHLPESAGLDMYAGFISRFDASDKRQEEALAARALAELEGQGKVAAAEKAAEVLTISSQAELEADRRRAEGKAADLEAILRVLADNARGADPNVLARAAADIVAVTKMSDPRSNVRAWASAGGVLGLSADNSKNR